MRNYSIKTERLGLRNWQESDILPATIMNADKRVMEFFPKTWTQNETERFIKRMQQHYEDHGFCYFAVDRLDTGTFIGFIGLLHQTFESDFTPCIDMGWRLILDAWGNGFATEGAFACLKYAFTTLKLESVYAIAPKQNKKSQHVMQKIGMQEYLHFVHPKLDVNTSLKNCVVYQKERENYKTSPDSFSFSAFSANFNSSIIL